MHAAKDVKELENIKDCPPTFLASYRFWNLPHYNMKRTILTDLFSQSCQLLKLILECAYSILITN